jgi:hypothetical protein
MDAVMIYLENDPNLRFIPLGPSSAAGVIAAAFFIMLVAWIYNAVRFRGFLVWSIVRIILFCAIGTVGYILKIVCNSLLNDETITNSQTSMFINIYIASNALTAIGNFILFTGLLSITRSWVTAKRSLTDTQQISRDSRIFKILILLTIVAMVLTIVGSALNQNTLRLASNAIFVALIVFLLLAIRRYHHNLDNNTYVQSNKFGASMSHPYAVQFLLFLNTFILLIAQAFKLSQYAVPVGSPALKNVAIIYIFGPVLDLIILIILAVTWGPVFHATIWTELVARRQAETANSEQVDTTEHPMTDMSSQA